MTYKPMTETEWRDLNRTDSFVWPTAHSCWWREQAIEKHILARIEQQGLVIVPKDPTAEMLEAGNVALIRIKADPTPTVFNRAFYTYKAMIEATKEST